MALRRIAQTMNMSDEVWRRHASPWSVWTRLTCLPLIVLALWSREWLGWGALVPVTLALVWTWLNPRMFREPDTLDTWASLGVLGERIHIYRPEDVAAHHRVPVALLTWGPLIGVVPMIWGLWALNVWPTIVGMSLTILLKLWFVDRMVWIAREWHAAGHAWSDLDQG